ncbi:hypothetical protein HOU02_gp054 [Caulobacter phage CcrBL9]|uniref:Uncharacterized protein n=1 Tax=Caulobacter phage CcrBL9 TaxID=2283270 RepID=A0A385EEA7_9CAUD|nr:hypothetical protein HOU02_gp054 [Caulobacter phage CcrBL9]AXQ69078.1 hypothetical protein CcrBL9_gp054c [Caulobacter phage CcrBL9]
MSRQDPFTPLRDLVFKMIDVDYVDDAEASIYYLLRDVVDEAAEAIQDVSMLSVAARIQHIEGMLEMYAFVPLPASHGVIVGDILLAVRARLQGQGAAEIMHREQSIEDSVTEFIAAHDAGKEDA